MTRLKILDWYVHQGHQREFAKINHDICLVGANKKIPSWNEKHRPLNENITLSDEASLRDENFDVVIVRSPVQRERVSYFVKKGAVPIAVVQTTTPFDIPSYCRHVVWNSLDVMTNYSKKFPDKRHYYIVHGYDPEEFCNLNLEKNKRILTVANAFRSRSHVMGFPLWDRVSSKLQIADVVGHGNLDLYKVDRQAEDFEQLIRIYNSYSVYFNPTHSSAMPRSRAEAAMCGMPIVSTNNYEISKYFAHKKNAILSNDDKEIVLEIKRLLGSSMMRNDFGNSAREIAIKHFHIKDFISSWESVLGDAV